MSHTQTVHNIYKPDDITQIMIYRLTLYRLLNDDMNASNYNISTCDK